METYTNKEKNEFRRLLEVVLDDGSDYGAVIDESPYGKKFYCMEIKILEEPFDYD